MTNELLVPGGELVEGFGAVDSTDQSSSGNYAKLLNKSSKEVDSGEGKAGQIIDSQGVVLNGKNFLPVFKYNTFIQFNDESEGLGVKRKTFDASEDWVLEGLKWIDGEKPLVTKVVNLICVFDDDFENPVVLSFRSTSIKTVSKIIQSARKANPAVLYHKWFTLGSNKEEARGYSYYVMTAKPVEGKITAPTVKKAKLLFAKQVEDYSRMANLKVANGKSKKPWS